MRGLLGLLLVAGLIAANGLFVAAEFALVSVRRASVEELAGTGDRRGRLVSRELVNLPFALSSAQFGITVTSLLVGYLAERTVGETLIRPVLALVGVPAGATLAVTVGGAFLISTVTQMVVGELFPKNLALSRALGVARTVTPFTRAFGLVLGPVIRVFDRAAEALARRAFRVDVRAGLDWGHSLDDLARIIAVSGEEGSLSAEQAQLLQRAVELGDRRVGEVMVPRPDVVWLEAGDTLEGLRGTARRTGHSRFPIRGETEDDVLGTVHVKDLLRVVVEQRSTTPVTAIATEPLAVPESATVRQLLGGLRRGQATFAVVVDEYGSTAGIATVENVLEALVGDIEDEFDHDVRAVRRVGADRYLARGSLRVDALEDQVGLELPDGEYETLAGFVLDRLGHIPEPGERVRYGDWEFEVSGVQGVRVTEVALHRLREAEP